VKERLAEKWTTGYQYSTPEYEKGAHLALKFVGLTFGLPFVRNLLWTSLCAEMRSGRLSLLDMMKID